ncbi:MAG: hypothetical protein AB1921_19665 [Thermodesulfobacteriota bacterium]
MPEKKLGISIDAEAVSAVLVRGGLTANQVLAYARVPVDGEVDQDRAVDLALAQIREKEGQDQSQARRPRKNGKAPEEPSLGRITAAASFSDAGVSFRRLRLPFTEPKKIRQVLPFELEQVLPFKAEDIVADYQVLKKDEGAVCLASVAESATVAGKLGYLSNKGISADILSAAGLAEAVLFLDGSEPAEPGIFLHLACSGATLVLFSGARAVFVRRIQGNFQNDPEGLARLISWTVSAFGEATGEELSAEILSVTGPGTEWPGFVDLLSQRLSLSVVSPNMAVLTNTTVAADPGLEWRPHLMDGALCLALATPSQAAGFNLRQGPFAVRRRLDEYKDEIFHGAVLLVALLFILTAGFFADTYVLSREAARLRQEVAARFHSLLPKEPVADPVRQLSAKIKELEKSRGLPEEEGPAVRAIDVLKIVSEKVPANADFTVQGLTFSPEGLQLSGEADAISTVDEVQKALTSARILDKVTIVSTDIDNRTNRVRFRIRANLARQE